MLPAIRMARLATFVLLVHTMVFILGNMLADLVFGIPYLIQVMGVALIGSQYLLLLAFLLITIFSRQWRFRLSAALYLALGIALIILVETGLSSPSALLYGVLLMMQTVAFILFLCSFFKLDAGILTIKAFIAAGLVFLHAVLQNTDALISLSDPLYQTGLWLSMMIRLMRMISLFGLLVFYNEWHTEAHHIQNPLTRTL
ncbi:MAG: hypothetical protein EA375_00140 [Acholeplasmataceae bacterium]|nr:MAG: hypothetical protein EA375_00140 [Acholeplasmataceae bacterium]